MGSLLDGLIVLNSMFVIVLLLVLFGYYVLMMVDMLFFYGISIGLLFWMMMIVCGFVCVMVLMSVFWFDGFVRFRFCRLLKFLLVGCVIMMIVMFEWLVSVVVWLIFCCVYVWNGDCWLLLFVYVICVVGVSVWIVVMIGMLILSYGLCY